VRLAKLTEHRLIFINTLGESTFLPGDIDEKRRLILALQYAGGRPAGVAGQPDILFFNDGIEHELRRIGQFFREAYLQLIIEAVGPAGDLQPAGMTIEGRTLPDHIIFSRPPSSLINPKACRQRQRSAGGWRYKYWIYRSR
jgi:hypothetical protein